MFRKFFRWLGGATPAVAKAEEHAQKSRGDAERAHKTANSISQHNAELVGKNKGLEAKIAILKDVDFDVLEAARLIRIKDDALRYSMGFPSRKRVRLILELALQGKENWPDDGDEARIANRLKRSA